MAEGSALPQPVLGLQGRSQTSTLPAVSRGRVLSRKPLLTKRRTPRTGDEAALAQEFIHGEASIYW